jgi:hypothetical protein
LITLRTLDALTPKKETPQERERAIRDYRLDADSGSLSDRKTSGGGFYSGHKESVKLGKIRIEYCRTTQFVCALSSVICTFKKGTVEVQC